MGAGIYGSDQAAGVDFSLIVDRSLRSRSLRLRRGALSVVIERLGRLVGRGNITIVHADCPGVEEGWARRVV